LTLISGVDPNFPNNETLNDGKLTQTTLKNADAKHKEGDKGNYANYDKINVKNSKNYKAFTDKTVNVDELANLTKGYHNLSGYIVSYKLKLEELNKTLVDLNTNLVGYEKALDDSGIEFWQGPGTPYKKEIPAI